MAMNEVGRIFLTEVNGVIALATPRLSFSDFNFFTPKTWDALDIQGVLSSKQWCPLEILLNSSIQRVTLWLLSCHIKELEGCDSVGLCLSWSTGLPIQLSSVWVARTAYQDCRGYPKRSALWPTQQTLNGKIRGRYMPLRLPWKR